MDDQPLRLEAVGYDHPDALRLIERVQEEYVVRYGSRDEAPIDPLLFDPPHGIFFIGYLGDMAVATGAWRRSEVVALGSTKTAEIKRMYVVPEARGHGLARRVLAHLETSASASGIDVLILETGTGQPEAIGLYTSAGYELIPGFGYYTWSPLSRCFARAISDRP